MVRLDHLGPNSRNRSKMAGDKAVQAAMCDGACQAFSPSFQKKANLSASEL
jgi:hypothetical protein